MNTRFFLENSAIATSRQPALKYILGGTRSHPMLIVGFWAAAALVLNIFPRDARRMHRDETAAVFTTTLEPWRELINAQSRSRIADCLKESS
jgi:hypothetical protein